MVVDNTISLSRSDDDKKVRNSNIELYRIIVMLSIVAHHYVVNSGVLDVAKEDPTSLRSLYYYIFGAWGKTGINCFVLITGYFMCKSKITIRKYLKLLAEIYFYAIVINGMFLVSGYAQPTMKMFIYGLLPIQMFGSNFVGCFLIYFLMIPFLNMWVYSMTQRQHLLLLLIILFVFTIIGSLPKIGFKTEYISWFAILHLVSSYLRLYNSPVKLSHTQWGLLSLILFFLASLSIVGMLWIGKAESWDFFVNDSNKIFAFTLGFSLFIWFKGMKIPQSKIINGIAKSAFGVLLIHANSDIMRKWLWKDRLDVIGQYDSDNYILFSILSVLGIYVICTLIDQLRIFLFEKPFFSWIEKHHILDRWQRKI